MAFGGGGPTSASGPIWPAWRSWSCSTACLIASRHPTRRRGAAIAINFITDQAHSVAFAPPHRSVARQSRQGRLSDMSPHTFGTTDAPPASTSRSLLADRQAVRSPRSPTSSDTAGSTSQTTSSIRSSSRATPTRCARTGHRVGVRNPWPDPMCVISGLATVTEQLTFTTGVYIAQPET